MQSHILSTKNKYLIFLHIKGDIPNSDPTIVVKIIKNNFIKHYVIVFHIEYSLPMYDCVFPIKMVYDRNRM